ncbi:hypothetical protein [Terriglobus roseus]|nr:hypothetical protein [Terriglobus roseus]
MNDIYHPDDLFEAFQEAAFHRLGEMDWTPLFSFHDEQELGGVVSIAAEIRRIINSSNQRWFLFINAREIPGSNRQDYRLPNGWMDSSKHRNATLNILGQFLSANSEIPAAEVLTPRLAQIRKDEEQHHLARGSDKRDNTLVVILMANQSAMQGNSNLLRRIERQWRSRAYYNPLPPLPHSIGQLSQTTVIDSVIEWASDPLKQRFLQALVSMRRPRQVSLAWSRAMHEEWLLVDESQDRNHATWLDQLEFHGLI